jgi:hypothetical protein
MLGTRETALCVIGPWSMAEQTQNAPHSVLGSVKSMGWAYQRRTNPRPGVHLFGTVEIRLVAYDFSLDGNLF